MAKKKKTTPTLVDITKTGYMNYKDLQNQNNSYMPGEIMSYEDANKYFYDGSVPTMSTALQAVKSYNANIEGSDEQSPIWKGSDGKDYFGNSVFDPDIVTDSDWQKWNSGNYNELRAENQPWYSQLLNGIGKAGVLAVTTAAELGGLIYGIGQGIYNETQGKSFLQGLWDNPITNALQSINEYSEEYMPNYYTRDEQENPFGNIFTANFLGDKILKNLGFMVGAFYGGIPVSKAVGAVGKAAVKGARAASLAERAGMAKRVGELAATYGDDIAGLNTALAAEHLTEAERAQRILAGFDKVKNAAQATRATTQTLGALGSAVNEGAIEAINNSKDWANLQIQKENERYQQAIEESMALVDKYYGGSEMEDALKIRERMKLAEEHEKQLAAIEEGRARVGNADLLLNIPILLASNMYQLGKLYTRGFDSTRRQLGSFWNGHALSGKLGSLKSDKTAKGAILSALYKSNTEGLEEYLQRAASDGAGNAVSESIQRYFEAGQNDKAKNNVDDYIVGFGKAIADNLGNPNAWEEYMIGAVSSMLGMPVFGSQTKNSYIAKDNGVFGFAGGIIGNYNDYMDAKRHEEKVAEYLNGRVKDPKFKALYDALRKNNDLDKLINGTLAEDDKAKYKELEYEKLFNDINAAASSGHLAEFKELIGYNKEYTDDELSDIVKTTTKTVTADEQRKSDEQRKAFLEKEIGALEESRKAGVLSAVGKENQDNFKKELEEVNTRLEEDKSGKKKYQDRDEGPFLMRDVKGNTIEMNATEEGKQQMREILERNRDNLLSSIDDYLRIRNDIDIESDGRLSDDEIAMLTMMRGKILDYDKRSAEMAYDLVSNLKNVEKVQEGWKKKLSDENERTQRLFDNVSKQLENAKKKGAKKKEIERLEKDKEAAEKKLKKSKAALRDADEILDLLKLLTEEKETTAGERAAEAKGYGDNFFKRMAARFRRGQLRNINSDEAQAILANPAKMTTLINYILSNNSDLDTKTKQRLCKDAIDLFHLATEKIAYNDEIRKDLKDPSRINEAHKAVQDKLSQEQIDNLSEELALRIREADNMAELDTIMSDAFRQNRGVAVLAMQKAKQTSDDSQKQFLEDYEEGKKYYDSFVTQASQYPDEVGAGMLGTANEAWEYALQNNMDLKNTFIQSMEDASKTLDAEISNSAKEQAKAIRQVLKDLNSVGSAVATNKNAKKKNTSKKKGSDDDAQDKDDKSHLAALAALNKKKGKNSLDSKDGVLKSIRDEVISLLGDDEDFDNVKYDNLTKELKDAISKYNEDHPDDMVDVAAEIKKVLDQVADEDIKNAGNYKIEDKDDTEAGDYEEGSQRAKDMHNNLRILFKSDHPTEFINFLDFRNPFTSDSDQLMAIKKLLQDYKAYQFVDKNYLGYVALAHDGHPTIHFLKSTDPAVDGNGGTDSTIFMAIEWDSTAQNAVRKHGFNGSKKADLLTNEVSPVDIDGKQYQIVGVLTFSSQKDVSPELSSAFFSLQNAINGELNPGMDAAREAGAKFVKSKLTTTVDVIFTGRLEKRDDEKDEGEKVSLHTYMTDSQGSNDRRTSTEWENGSEFYFGTIVNGVLNVTEREEFLDRMVEPNEDWRERHNGAVLLFVPKPDGKFYPVRCTRLTVKKWLDTVVDGQHKGKELLENAISGSLENEYINNIIKYLKTLFDEDATIGDRMKAKMMLSKYFIFGNNSPIHFESGSVTLTIDKTRYDIDGDTVDEKINSFFNALSEANVMFTLPSQSIEDISGRDIVESGIFEIGLRGFYNFNANFTVVPITPDGKKLNVQIPADDDEHFTGGGSAHQGNDYELNITGETKKYHIDTKTGEVTVNGEPVSPEESNFVSIVERVEAGEYPLLLTRFIPNNTSKEYKNLVMSNLPQFQGVYIFNVDGTDWIYDSRVADHSKRLYKASEDVLKKFKSEVQQAIQDSEIIRKGALALKRGETPGADFEEIDVPTTKGGRQKIKAQKVDYANIKNGDVIWYSGPETSAPINKISVTAVDSDNVYGISDFRDVTLPKERTYYKEVGRPLDDADNKKEFSALSIKEKGELYDKVLQVQGIKGASERDVQVKALINALNNGEESLYSGILKEIEYYYNNGIVQSNKPLKPLKRGDTPSGLFVGKTLDTLNDKGTPLEISLITHRKSPLIKGRHNTKGKDDIYGIFEALQYAEENGIPINYDEVATAIEKMMSANKADKIKKHAALVEEIKRCI